MEHYSLEPGTHGGMADPSLAGQGRGREHQDDPARRLGEHAAEQQER
jgi:hypothetical protein